MGNFKTKFCWWPVRLARHAEGPEYASVTIGDAKRKFPVISMEFIGWVWLQKAHLTNNLNHGWIAVLDSKPMKPRCKTCGQVLPTKGEINDKTKSII